MKIYEVTVTHREARAELLSILGRDKVLVTSPQPMRLTLPMLGEGIKVYLLDLQALSQVEFDRLVAHVAEKYGLGKMIALNRLQAEGLALPASAGTLRIRETEHA